MGSIVQVRLGIGPQLVTAPCAAAAEAGYGDVFVPVDSGNEAALDFYRALGGASAAVTIFKFSAARG
jgi:ribosomal protein S18 acetylase RimI-like enzyme